MSYRRRGFVIAACALATSLLAGCGDALPTISFHPQGQGAQQQTPAPTQTPGTRLNVDVPPFSNNVLVSFDYGGMGWGEYYDCISADVMVMRDGRVQVYVEEALAGEKTLTPEEYEILEQGIDLPLLYTIVVEEDINVCDGDSAYLYLYGEDDSIIKRVGGYEPQSTEFWAARKLLVSTIDSAWLQEMRNIGVDALKKAEQPKFNHLAVLDVANNFDDLSDWLFYEGFADCRYGTSEGYYIDTPSGYSIFRGVGNEEVQPAQLIVYDEYFDVVKELDFSAYVCPDAGAEQNPALRRNILWAMIPEDSDVMYVSFAMPETSANEKEGAFVIAVSLSDSTETQPFVLWESEPLIASAYNFVYQDGYLVTGCGEAENAAGNGNSECGFIYLVHADTGDVGSLCSLETNPKFIYMRDDIIYVKGDYLCYKVAIEEIEE